MNIKTNQGILYTSLVVEKRLRMGEWEKTIGVNSQKSRFCLKIVHNYVFIQKICKIYIIFGKKANFFQQMWGCSSSCMALYITWHSVSSYNYYRELCFLDV